MSLDAAGLIPDCNRGTTVNSAKTGLGTACGFNELMGLANKVISFLLFTIATPLVALIVCYAGFLLLTSGGSSEKLTKAKHIFKNVLIGYIVALAAWLIIHTIVKTLGFTGDDFLDESAQIENTTPLRMRV
ncbi:MAG: pilin [Patescibacteria group bacterium]